MGLKAGKYGSHYPTTRTRHRFSNKLSSSHGQLVPAPAQIFMPQARNSRRVWLAPIFMTLITFPCLWQLLEHFDDMAHSVTGFFLVLLQSCSLGPEFYHSSMTWGWDLGRVGEFDFGGVSQTWGKLTGPHSQQPLHCGCGGECVCCAVLSLFMEIKTRNIIHKNGIHRLDRWWCVWIGLFTYIPVSLTAYPVQHIWTQLSK